MKKIKLLLFVVILTTFFSCQDESGEFARPILSNTELLQGLRECLTVSLDSANAHLAVSDGFYQYNSNSYRINFPSSAEMIIDTLSENGYRAVIDTLILRMNRMAEANGSIYRTQFTALINRTTFPDAKGVINGNDNAACTYFKSVQLLPLIDVLKPILSGSMTAFEVNSCWEEILTIYARYNSSPVILDLPYEITRQISENIITEMAEEEKLIRSQEEHRVTDLLKSVFAD